jgi:predicted amidophosphoribosyltransferase
MQSILNFLEVKCCFGCNNLGDYFCLRCRNKFSPKTLGLTSTIQLSTVSQRNPAMMRAIAGWKDRHLKILTRIFADLLICAEPNLLNGKPQQIITPPQRKSAFAIRGFNPVSDLALELQKRNRDLNYQSDTSRYLREPRDQRGLNAAERRANVKGVFEVTPKCGIPILLLDDVWTTGSTMKEMRRAIGDNYEVSGILVLSTAYRLGAKDRWNVFD